MRNNSKNIRTEFKLLIKDRQREKIDNDFIVNWLAARGFWGDWNWVDLILKTNISARVIHRLGRAAKKKNAYIRLSDLYWVRFKKTRPMGYSCTALSSDVKDYHQIPFVKPMYVDYYNSVITRDIELCTLEGKRADFKLKHVKNKAEFSHVVQVDEECIWPINKS